MSEAKSCGPAAERYEALVADRLVYLTDAREASKYTIPSLYPPSTTSTHANLYKPWQSLGARGVNNIAAKLLMALFPSTQSFFRLSPAEKYKSEIPEDERPAFEKGLSTVERIIRKQFDKKAFRGKLNQALKQLVVGGTTLLHIPEDGFLRVFSLSQFVVRKDPSGNLLETVVKESVDYMALPPEVRKAIRDREEVDESGKVNTPDTVDVYTHVKLDGDKYKIYQEAEGIHIPGSDGTYPKDRCPWLVLTWDQVDAEHYGRSLCGQMIGDLRAFENLSKARTEAGVIASRVVFVVKPGSLINVKDVANAPNGSFVVGVPDDIKALQAERTVDMQVADKQADEIAQRLSLNFLLNSSIQRDAERVTAEEIRFMATELESTLGGVYSVQAATFQLPLVKVLMHNCIQSGELPNFPTDTVDLTITTGFDALGRTGDIQKLDQLLSTAAAHFGPEAVAQYVSVGAYMQIGLASYGIEGAGLIRSDEQVMQSMQQMQAQSLLEKAAPNAVKSAGDQMLQQQQTQEQPNG